MTDRSPATRKRGALNRAVLCAPLEDEVLAVEDEALPVEVPLPEEEDAAAGRVDMTTAEVAETVTVAVPSST